MASASRAPVLLKDIVQQNPPSSKKHTTTVPFYENTGNPNRNRFQTEILSHGLGHTAPAAILRSTFHIYFSLPYLNTLSTPSFLTLFNFCLSFAGHK